MGNYCNVVQTISQADLAACDGSPAHTPYDTMLLCLDETGEIRLERRTVYGAGDGVPEAEWYRRRLVWQVRGNTDIESLRESLVEGGVVANLLDIVRSGHQVEHGRGVLDERADEARQQIENVLTELPESDWAAWQVDEWLSGAGYSPDDMLRDFGLAVDSDAAAIDAAATTIVADAARDRVVLIGDVAQELARLQARALEAAADHG